jgi:hypothetical protein
MMWSLLDDDTTPYIDMSTRSVIINFNLYMPSADALVAVEILTEFMISGVVLPTYLHVYVFNANVHEKSGGKLVQVADIIRLILCFYLYY